MATAARGGGAVVVGDGSGSRGGASQEAMSSSSGWLTAARSIKGAPPGYTFPKEAATYGVSTWACRARQRQVLGMKTRQL